MTNHKSQIGMDSDIPLYFVIPTLGGSHVSETCTKLLSSLGEFDKLFIIHNGALSVDLKEQSLDQRVTYLRTEPFGASFSRNYGIMHLMTLSPTMAGVIFANDRSTYSRESLSVARRFLKFNSNKIGLGSWKVPSGSVILEPKDLYASKTDVLRAYEPAMLIPIALIRKGLLWNENFGPGPKTKFKSGDGALFLTSSLARGAELIGLPEFDVENPISNFKLTLRKLIVKGFQYGLGYIAFVRFIKGKNRCAGLSILPFALAPIVRFFLRHPYWRANGVVWAVSSTLGRIWGLVIKINFGDFIV